MNRDISNYLDIGSIGKKVCERNKDSTKSSKIEVKDRLILTAKSNAQFVYFGLKS